jgi:methyl acetate hydrolase
MTLKTTTSAVQARIQAVLDDAVADGLPGLVAAARLPSGEVVEAAAGVRGADNPASMTGDTVFWIASFTKAITTAGALQLVEQGRIGLDDPLGRQLPQLAAPKVLSGFDDAGEPILRAAREPVTLRRLLTHQSGFAYPFCHLDLGRYASLRPPASPTEAPDYPVMFEPGSDWTYGIGIDWVGKLIEQVSGEALAGYLARRVFNPLGMTETGFGRTEAQQGRRASMHARGEDGKAVATPFEYPAPPSFSMGGGGLYSTASDYLRFLNAILDNGAPILTPASVTKMRTVEAEGLRVGILDNVGQALCIGFDPFPGETKQWGLGFVMNPKPGPNGRAAGSLAWAGLGNCYYWADPTNGVAGVFLTQLFPFGDAAAVAAFGAFERAVYDA